MRVKCSIAVSWIQVGLAIVPGLMAVALRSYFLEILDVGVQGGASVYNSLAVASALLIIAGLLWKREFVPWMFPAVGVFLSLVPGLVMDLLFPSPGPPPPIFDTLANLWPVAAWGVSIIIIWGYRHDVSVPKMGWVFLGLVVAVSLIQGSVIMLFMIGLMVLPMAVGLTFAHRYRLLAGLVPVVGMYWWVDSIYDPSYFVPSNYATIIEAVVAFAFLVVTPVWVLSSSSSRRRLIGLLLPPILALIGCEVVRSVVYSPGYSLEMWLTRGLGAGQLAFLIACAVVVYQSARSRAESNQIGRLSGAA